MRKDEEGNSIPGTLGEYRHMCVAIGGDECKAVQFLDEKIANSPGGADEAVLAHDSQMRNILMPMLIL